MSVQAMAWALYKAPTRGISDGAKLALLNLADHVDKNGRAAWPHASSMAVDMEVSVRTVRRRLEELEAAGLIVRGDQEYVSHIRPGYRPIVWDLPLHLSRGADLSPLKSDEAAPSAEVTDPEPDDPDPAPAPGSGEADPAPAPTAPPPESGVTYDAPLSEKGVSGVTAVAGRGDRSRRSEVTPGVTQNRPRTVHEPLVSSTSATRKRAWDQSDTPIHDLIPAGRGVAQIMRAELGRHRQTAPDSPPGEIPGQLDLADLANQCPPSAAAAS